MNHPISEPARTAVSSTALLELLDGWRRVRDACEQLAKAKLALQPADALEYFAKADVWNRAIAGLEAAVASNSNDQAHPTAAGRTGGAQRKDSNEI